MNTHKFRKAFTLVEIMIVVCIIALLGAITIPNYIKVKEASQKNACATQMKAMSDSIDRWLSLHGGVPKTAVSLDPTNAPTDADIFGADKPIASKPLCPSGGTYKFGMVNKRVACSVHGELL